MANPHANHHHHLAGLLLVFLLLTSSSYGRLLNGFSLEATEPTLNLALPSDRVVPEEEEHAGRHVSPCDHMILAGNMPSPGMRMAGGKYGPMILNMLPKGTKVPPSGPSKGTNDLNN